MLEKEYENVRKLRDFYEDSGMSENSMSIL